MWRRFWEWASEDGHPLRASVAVAGVPTALTVPVLWLTGWKLASAVEWCAAAFLILVVWLRLRVIPRNVAIQRKAEREADEVGESRDVVVKRAFEARWLERNRRFRVFLWLVAAVVAVFVVAHVVH